MIPLTNEETVLIVFGLWSITRVRDRVFLNHECSKSRYYFESSGSEAWPSSNYNDAFDTSLSKCEFCSEETPEKIITTFKLFTL